MEMQSTLALNTSTCSSVASACSSDDDGDTRQLAGDTAAETSGGESARESAGSVGTVATASTHGSSSSKSVRSTSASSSSVSSSSRKALDRYLGRRSRGGSVGSVGTSVSGSVASASASVGGSVGGSVGTSASGNNTSLGSSSSSSGDSMDNNSNHTLPGCQRGGGPSASLLPSVKEESFHSLSSLGTSMVDNTSANGGNGNGVARMAEDDNDGTTKNNGSDTTVDNDGCDVTVANGTAPPIAATACNIIPSNGSTAQGGILRERSYSKEDLNDTTTMTSAMSNETKSVRFMSPLGKKVLKEKKDVAQCSPPRSSSSSSSLLVGSSSSLMVGSEQSEQLLVGGSGQSEQHHGVEHGERGDHLSSVRAISANDVVDTVEDHAVEENAVCISSTKEKADTSRTRLTLGTMAVVEEEEDMEFTMFVAGLRREVAGDHIELWSAFQSLLGRPQPAQTPLNPSHLNETQVQEFDRHGKKKKRKKIKMDPQTQKSLTTVHKHLMENGRIKGKFMKNSSQLVNDKQVKKDRAEEAKQVKQVKEGKASSSRRPQSEEQSSKKDVVGRVEKDKNELHRADSAQKGRDTLSNSTHSQSSSHGSIEAVNVTHGKQEQLKKSFREKKSSKLRKLVSSSSSNNSNADNTDSKSSRSFSAVKLKSVNRTNSNCSRSVGSNNNNNEKSPTATNSPKQSKQRLSWMEALKKKQKSLRLKQLTDIDTNNGPLEMSPQHVSGRSVSGSIGSGSGATGNGNNNNNNSPTSSKNTITLRRVASPRKKPRMTPPSTPKEEPAAAPWANVQLRSTPNKRESMTPTLQPTTSSFDSSHSSSQQHSLQSLNGSSLQPVTLQPNGSWNSSSSSTSSRYNFVLSPVNQHAPKNFSETSSSSSSLPPLCCIGDIIDLNALPKKLFPNQENDEIASAIMFTLKHSAKDSKDAEKIVIVGKIAIVTCTTTTAPSNVPINGPRKATIAWYTRRSEIRALTLNVEATGANLAHAHGRMPLLFECAEVCLDFAQAFYRVSSGVSSAGGGASSSAAAAGASSSSEAGASAPPALTNAARSKSLTEDEQSLLENYRQFSQGDRTKLRLTCLSPRGEEEEVEVEVSLNNLPSSSSNKGGNKGVIDEKAANKYKNLVQMGVPRDAVRHKMVMEGVDASTISAVLDGDNDGAQKSTTAPAPSASLSSADRKDATGGLSKDEEKIALKYRKMIKMGIPLDAVQHKMKSDEISSNIMDAILNTDNKQPKKEEREVNVLDDKEKAIASKYRKMMNMGVPAEGVRHKMNMEGVDEKIINAVFNNDASKEQQVKKKAGTAPQLSSEEEKIASKYRKMLKMGIPLDGVTHKMKQDSIDLKIVSVLVEEASPSNGAAKSSASKKSTKPVATVGPSLTAKEEAIASKFRKMLKVCMPKAVVQHKMKQEGVSAKIAEAVLGKGGNNGSAAAPPANKANARKTIAFHWTTSNLAPELLEQSIFGRSELKKRKLASINPEESDIKKLEELFQKRNNSKTANKLKKAAGQEDTSTDMAKLLDLTRANNIAISVKAFNDFTFRSLAETINDLDPDGKIVGERVQFIVNILPSPKEVQAIKKYTGDDDKLITAELFFRQLVSIKRIEDKVQVMKTMVTFEEHIEESRAGFKTLQEVCSQVMNSEKLIQVLEMVLNIGNLMNAGTLNGGVDAFKFESLPRLSQTKSADGKTTVLDYIVETFIEKGERQALLLMSEFPDIQDSSRLLIGDLIGEMTTLRNDYKLCKTELTSMKRDQSSKRVTRSMTKKIIDESEVGDPRKAMFAAIQARKAKHDSPQLEPPVSADPRQALFAAITSKKNSATATSDNNDDSPASSDVKYSPGVHRLQKFLSHSKTILSLAERDQDAAIRACKGLAVYCGEEGGERSTALLLKVLSDFALSLENGVKKYDQRVETEQRKAAKKMKEIEKEKEKGKENRQNVVPISSKKLLRASSLQPHVGAIDKVKRLNTPGQGRDSMNAVLNAIKDNGSRKRDNSPGPTQINDPKQALLASIKNRKDSLPSKPLADGVPDRVKHINNTMGRKVSRVLLVNRMLSEAPASVKQDFLKGVTYKETDDPLLKKIYEKEDNGVDTKAVESLKPVDPRRELFAAIQSRNTQL